MATRRALDIAMDFRRGDSAGTLLAVGPLPDGVKDLLRIVADGEWRSPATEHVYARYGADEIRAASATYLTVALFDRKLDPYRVLGLAPGATPEDLRENKRLLLKWLHPDRNPNERERIHLGKVLEAVAAIEKIHAASATRADVRPPQIVMRPSPPRATKAPRPSAVRQVLTHVASEVVHIGKVLTVTAATTVLGLITWRFYMNEPLGASLERYAKLTLGILPW